MKRLLAISVGVACLILTACGSSDNQDTSVSQVKQSQEDIHQKHQDEPVTKSKPISPYAFTEYNKQDYPRIYQQWGKDWIAKLEAHERAAAEKIANSDNACDSIDYIGLSEEKSTPKKEIVVFVDCANKERFFVSDKDIKKNEPLKAQSEKAMSEQQALQQCRELVRNGAKYPNSVDFKLLDTAVQTSKTHGNVIITIGFTAKNAVGAEMPVKARCLFTPEGKAEITYRE